LKKLAPLTRSRHTLLYEAKRQSPEPSQFPQYFENRVGLWLRCYHWPVKQPKAIVFVIHGYGEHLGRFEHVRQWLNDEGYSVYGIDQQGHGQSEGDRGYVENFIDYVYDNLDYFHFVQNKILQNQPLPCFLLGHSMGGLIAIHTAQKSIDKGLWPWNGVLLSGASLFVDPKVKTPFMVFFATVLNNIFPKLTMGEINSKALSKIPAVAQNYNTDPLVHKQGMAARWAFEMLRAVDDVTKNVRSVQFPFLIMHGSADRIVQAQGSEFFYENSSSRDKKIKIYEGSFHEIFNDLEKERVFNDMKIWIKERLN